MEENQKKGLSRREALKKIAMSGLFGIVSAAIPSTLLGATNSEPDNVESKNYYSGYYSYRSYENYGNLYNSYGSFGYYSYRYYR